MLDGGVGEAGGGRRVTYPARRSSTEAQLGQIIGEEGIDAWSWMAASSTPDPDLSFNGMGEFFKVSSCLVGAARGRRYPRVLPTLSLFRWCAFQG